ncbi:hypothetical protein EDB89DRAFT_1912178 [Lactarius sanguifluus]|nr:hypothetical protein EDB89DRAFT_1912178 [Lactarius sanguifluus]
MWLFQGNIFIEWKSTGSLLWIHGKPGSGKSVICSSVIQDIMTVCEARSAIMAYFYFNFKDLKKQTCHDLLLSLVSQLSTRSSPCCDILHHIYKTHEDGTRQPGDDTLKECLKEMLRLLRHGPIFIVLDALDECPDSPGIPSPRHEDLQLVKELIDLGLQSLHICATSRPEVDIRAVLKQLASRSVSLHDQSGQQMDIADYIQSVVNLSPSSAMRRWRADDRNLVIKTLTERADGMFRWVFCQLDALQHCFPPNLRQFLNELPETLDETYERILRGINKAQKDNARRLLLCLAVAVRPLLVEELAELLAFDFQASSPGIPKLKDDWQWDNHEEAVLSTCSSLITIVPSRDSRVVQFSHFSVKEYLTSPRLARSHEDVSKFHIDLNAAHTILAQACLGTLLRLDEHVDIKGFPLVKYAAEHWVDHARFEKVSSRVQDGIDDLFDGSKPHFAAWIRVHSVDQAWYYFSTGWFQQGFRGVRSESPLYYAAFCGFYDLVEDPNAQKNDGRTPLHTVASYTILEAVQVLLEHNADINSRADDGKIPLLDTILLGYCDHPEGETVDVVRRLLEYGADPNACDNNHSTPLHEASSKGLLEAARMLLSYGANVDEEDGRGMTPFQVASSKGRHEIRHEMTKLLLEHGAVAQA